MNQIDADLASRIEKLILAGELAQARLELAAISPKKIPPKNLKRFASLARRANLFTLALRLLWPRIRGPLAENLPDDVAEYCASLIQIGSTAEARRLLNQLPDLPEVDLYLGYCHVVEWNYDLAQSCFERYVEQWKDRVDPYWIMVAQINLLACLIFQGMVERALQESAAILRQARDLGAQLLLSNLHEIRAQCFIYLSETSKAADCLQLARQTAPTLGGVQELLLDKWALINKTTAEPTGFDRNEFIQLFERAKTAMAYEVARDCKYHMAKFGKQEQDFQAVYFGTPYPAFRRRLELLNWSPPREIVIPLEENHNPSIFEFENAILSTDDSAHLRTLTIFLRDFFRPVPFGQVFSELFPGEHFDPNSSANRVYQSLHRFKDWINSNRFGWELRLSETNFKLEIPPTAKRLLLPKSLPPADVSSKGLKLDVLKRLTKSDSLSRRDIENHLHLSEAQAQRLLKWAVVENLLVKAGHGTLIRYSFPK